jgi:hypothetical protein
MVKRSERVPWDLAAMLGAAAFLVFMGGVGVGYLFRANLERTLNTARTFVDDLLVHPLTTKWRYGGDFGLEIHAPRDDLGSVLVSGFFMDEEAVSVRLIDIARGETVKTWRPDPHEIRERSNSPSQTPDRFQPVSPLLTDDGGLIFIDNEGPVVRIDACSRIVWIGEGQQHHSLGLDLAGNLIVPSVDPPLDWPYQDLRNDSVARFTKDGERIESVSVAQILIDNDLDHLLNATYPYILDAVHLNDVEVARQDGEYWKAGDWALSLRQMNMIMIYRPATGDVVWYSIGPWQKQHDPDFNADGTLSVFGNDTVDLDAKRLITGHSDIYIVGPDQIVRTPFNEAMAAATVGTETQGVLDILPGGDAYVEETDRGRILRLGVEGLIWTFNNTNGERAGVLNWSRHYPPGTLPKGALAPCEKS